MERHLNDTTSLCASCKRTVPAALWEVDGAVVMRKRCEDHGDGEVLISSNARWYHAMLAVPESLTPPEAMKPVAQGCPYDCGPCESHEQRLHLPIVPITSACNLDCPICYTHNKNEGAFHLSEDALTAILVHLRRAAPEKRIINITGGEPTMHPQFERIIELCRQEGIRRITVSTHGLRFLKDEALVAKLAALDGRVVLSFDSFTEEGNQTMLGGRFLAGKMKVLDLLERHDVNTTLLPVLARGVNDGELRAFVELALSKDFIRSVEFHPMTFTGQYGASFDRRARYTTYDVLADLERETEGRLRITDFVPSPAAHALCYLCTYLLKTSVKTSLKTGQSRWIPFPRFMSSTDLRDLLDGGLYVEPGPVLEDRLKDVIARLWSGDLACDDTEEVLAALKQLVTALFAPGLTDAQRLRIAERNTKAIYVHAHMDEENFDTDRIRKCCVGIREPDGTNIPSCAYNVLYRERDARFMEAPKSGLVTLGRGRA